jgi:hypothetical protein
MKIRPVGTELYHADRQTDMTKLIIAFRSFAKEPKYDLCAFIVLCCCEKVKHFRGSFVSDVVL